MTPDEIINTLYYYYPRGVMSYADEYEKSPENIRRVRVCDNIRINHVPWDLFKSEFFDYLKTKNSSFSDYTSFGMPIYWIEIGLNKEQNGKKSRVIMYLVLSAITNYWAFVFGRETYEGKPRYQTSDAFEEECVKKMEEILLRYFPRYKLLPDEYRDIPVPDLETPLTTEDLTIFTGLFLAL